MCVIVIIINYNWYFGSLLQSHLLIGVTTFVLCSINVTRPEKLKPVHKIATPICIVAMCFLSCSYVLNFYYARFVSFTEVLTICCIYDNFLRYHKNFKQ